MSYKRLPEDERRSRRNPDLPKESIPSKNGSNSHARTKTPTRRSASRSSQKEAPVFGLSITEPSSNTSIDTDRRHRAPFDAESIYTAGDESDTRSLLKSDRKTKEKHGEPTPRKKQTSRVETENQPIIKSKSDPSKDKKEKKPRILNPFTRKTNKKSTQETSTKITPPSEPAPEKESQWFEDPTLLAWYTGTLSTMDQNIHSLERQISDMEVSRYDAEARDYYQRRFRSEKKPYENVRAALRTIRKGHLRPADARKELEKVFLGHDFKALGLNKPGV